MKKKQQKKLDLDDKTLKVYNIIALIFGILSIVLSWTGFFGIIPGLLGICLSVTYYLCTKKIRLSYILSIIGSILSAFFISCIMILVYGIK